MSDEEYEALSTRAKTALKGMGISSAKEFKSPTREEVVKSRFGGLKTVAELKKLGYIKKTPKKKK